MGASRLDSSEARAPIRTSGLTKRYGETLALDRLELTPFAHIGFVPSESFRAGAALVMIAIGAAGAAGGLALLRGRDLVPA